MTTSPLRDRRTTGWLIGIGAALLFVAQLLIALAGPPPQSAAAIAAWVADNSFAISASNELLFFAIVLLVPGILLATRAASSPRPVAALAACTMLVLALAVLLALIPVEGRLVYPVFGIAIDDESTALALSLVFGGLHLVQLLFAVGLLCLAASVRSDGPRWRPLALLAVAIVQVAASFPWLVPVWVSVVAAAALFAVGAVIGGSLIRRR